MPNQGIDSGSLVLLWIVFSAVALAGLLAVLVWAVRTRQFSDSDRARFLPLRGGAPDTRKPPAGGRGEAPPETRDHAAP